MYFRKQSGIGLLELMLAMAIIAILIVMSISYFQSSKNKTLVQAGIEEMQDILGVVSGLSNPQASAGGIDESGNLGNLNNAVVLSGSIPREYIDSDSQSLASPWGKSVIYQVTYNT